MRLNRLSSLVVASALVVSAGIALYAQGQGAGAGQTQQPPPGRGGPPQNLQVLPKDWTTQQVQQMMRTFTAGLGVECSHCHTGGQADRAKDDKPQKGVARKMIKMMMAINADYLKDVGDPAAAGANKVTCFTCHRGALKPLNAPGGGTNQ